MASRANGTRGAKPPIGGGLARASLGAATPIRALGEDVGGGGVGHATAIFFSGPAGRPRRRRTAGSQPFASAARTKWSPLRAAPGTVGGPVRGQAPPGRVRSRGAVPMGSRRKKAGRQCRRRACRRSNPNLLGQDGLVASRRGIGSPAWRRRRKKRSAVGTEATFSCAGLFVLALGAPSSARDATQPAASSEEMASGTPAVVC